MVPSAAESRTESRSRERWRKPAFALFLLGYFLYFNWQDLTVAFAPDDMMNIFEYWRYGVGRLVYSQFFLWHDFYRPMGGVYYLPLFSLFGFNPLPYHAVTMALMLGAVCLVYKLGRLLGSGALAAWCAAIVVAYHGGLANLYYNTSFIYDVLCMIFFLAAAVLYIAPRSAGRPWRVWERIAFFACYLCALNSKEMAITLPLVILAYEWLYRRPTFRSGHDVRRWLAGPALTAVIMGIVALPYLYARVLGLGGLVHSTGYSVDFSFARVLAFQQAAIRDLFLLPQNIGWKTVASLWTVITYLAWRRDQPLLRWCWVVMLVTPIPVEFLQGRHAAVLAIPLVGWALFAGTLLVQATLALADFLGGEPLFRRIGRPARVVVLLAYVLVLWVAQNEWMRAMGNFQSMRVVGELTAHVIDQFRELHPYMRPRTKALFTNDPFEAWDMYFIAQLWFRDKTLDFRLQNKSHEPADAFDYVFDYRDGKLVQVKGR